jgi:hypothetical protein
LGNAQCVNRILLHSCEELLEFFSENRQSWPITDFCDSEYKPLDKAQCQSLLARISNQITHLGRYRTADQAKKVNAADPTIVLRIEAEIVNFASHLKPEYRSLFRSKMPPIMSESAE